MSDTTLTAKPTDRLVVVDQQLKRLDMLRLRLLLMIAQNPGYTASSYARMLEAKPAAICHIIQTMDEGRPGYKHKRNLIYRRQDIYDLRCWLIYLSPKGEMLLQAILDELLTVKGLETR